MTYEHDPVFKLLGEELLDARKDRDHARHLVKHVAQDAELLGKMLAEHIQSLNVALRNLKAGQGLIAELTSLPIAALQKAAWLETMAKVSECSCTSRVDRAAVDEARPAEAPTLPEAQIEAAYVEPRKVVPIRKFLLIGKPRGPGGAA